MANKATTTTTNAVGLSVREVDILCAMCQSFKSKPDTDMKKFEALTGFTPKSASSTLGRLLKRIRDTDLAAPETGKKKEGGRKRKAAKAAAEDGSEDAAGEDTLSKAKKSKRDRSNDETEKKGEGEGEGQGEDGGDKVVANNEVQDAGTDELA